jgi:hypothetical protein
LKKKTKRYEKDKENSKWTIIELKDIRKKGLISTMTERLSSGMGTGAAIGSSISDRTKATFTGIKQRFDPLNIARVVTGGSKFAPAFLGALTGRSKRDIGFFYRQKTTRLSRIKKFFR